MGKYYEYYARIWQMHGFINTSIYTRVCNDRIRENYIRCASHKLTNILNRTVVVVVWYNNFLFHTETECIIYKSVRESLMKTDRAESVDDETRRTSTHISRTTNLMFSILKSCNESYTREKYSHRTTKYAQTKMPTGKYLFIKSALKFAWRVLHGYYDTSEYEMEHVIL